MAKKIQSKLTWSLTTRKVSDLTKNGYNPRKISENEKRDLESSIKEFGTVVPVILNIGKRNNIIIGGEQRVKVYADLGIESIECMTPSRELTLTEEKELNLRLNKNTGSWDENLLKDFDMDMLLDVGFGDEAGAPDLLPNWILSATISVRDFFSPFDSQDLVWILPSTKTCWPFLRY
jgi:hypothetical protein